MSRNRMRFNLLLLEEGEFLFEEYAAILFEWAPSAEGREGRGPTSVLRGRMRVSSRCVSFEPDDTKEPIAKYPFRQVAGKPTSLLSASSTPIHDAVLGALAADGLHARDGFCFQPTQVVELKAGNVIGPYNTRTLSTAAGAPSEPASAVAKQQQAAPPSSEAPAGETSPGGKPLLPLQRNKKGDAAATAKSQLFGMFGGGGKKGGAASCPGGSGSPGGPGPLASGDSKRAPPSGEHLRGRTTIVFAFPHTPASAVLPMVERLWIIQQLAAGAHSGYERAALDGVLAGRAEGAFDLSLLGDFRERPLTPVVPTAIPVERIFPLVSCPGRLLVTEKAVYIQPVALNNIAGSDPVSKWPLREIRRVLRRRRLLREVGLELLLADSAAWSGGGGAEAAAAGLRSAATAAPSVFIVFRSPAVRDEVYRLLLTALRERRAGVGGGQRLGGGSSATASEFDPVVGDPSPDAVSALTKAWQAGALSNFEYLSALNSAAGRTVADLTQYPVMPWVIADYSSPTLDLFNPATFRDLSRPMGALNEKRLASVRARYKDMPAALAIGGGGEGEEDAPPPDPPFMYGTHYSTPGYCLHFLVRIMPEHMLHLQAGRFDAPDRLFFDVGTSWGGVTSVNMDVKELIPEFYDSDGSFLLIPDGVDLGVRQTGRRVGDVTLPPWAFDAGDFVAQCRAALESDHVSAHLHEWIDLIFGFKQRGEAAVAADNVFYHLTYEGAVDMEAVTDPDRRAALQAQISEFGQTPRQLFSAPHPPRSGAPVSPAMVAAAPVTATVVLSPQAAGAGVADAGAAGGAAFEVPKASAADAHSPAALAPSPAAEGSRSGGAAPGSDAVVRVRLFSQQAGEQGGAAARKTHLPSGGSGGGTSERPLEDVGAPTAATAAGEQRQPARNECLPPDPVLALPPDGPGREARNSSIEDDAGGAPLAVGSSPCTAGAALEAGVWSQITMPGDASPAHSSSSSGGALLLHSAAVVSLVLRARTSRRSSRLGGAAAGEPDPREVLQLVSASLDGQILVQELQMDAAPPAGASVRAFLLFSSSLAPCPFPRHPFSLHAAAAVHSVVHEGGGFAGLPVSALAPAPRDRRLCFASTWDGAVHAVDTGKGVSVVAVLPSAGPASAGSTGSAPLSCLEVADLSGSAAPGGTRSAAGSMDGASMLPARPLPSSGGAEKARQLVVVGGGWDGAVTAWRLSSRATASGGVAVSIPPPSMVASHLIPAPSPTAPASAGLPIGAITALGLAVPRSFASPRDLAATLGAAGRLLAPRSTVVVAGGDAAGNVSLLLLQRRGGAGARRRGHENDEEAACSDEDESFFCAASHPVDTAGSSAGVSGAAAAGHPYAGAQAVIRLEWCAADWSLLPPRLLAATRDGRLLVLRLQAAAPPAEAPSSWGSADAAPPPPFSLALLSTVVTGSPFGCCLALAAAQAGGWDGRRALSGGPSGVLRVWDTTPSFLRSGTSDDAAACVVGERGGSVPQSTTLRGEDSSARKPRVVARPMLEQTAAPSLGAGASSPPGEGAPSVTSLACAWLRRGAEPDKASCSSGSGGCGLEEVVVVAAGKADGSVSLWRVVAAAALAT